MHLYCRQSLFTLLSIYYRNYMHDIVLISFFTRTKALVDEKQTELRQGLQLPASYKEEASVEQLTGTQLCAQAG